MILSRTDVTNRFKNIKVRRKYFVTNTNVSCSDDYIYIGTEFILILSQILKI